MKEQIAAIVARLDAFAKRGDSAPILDDSAVEEALATLQAAQDDAADAEDTFRVLQAVAWLFWYRVLATPDQDRRADLQFAISLFRAVAAIDPDRVPEQLRPLLGGSVVSAETRNSADLEDRLTQETTRVEAGDLGRLDEVIRLLEQLADLVPADDPDHGRHLANLAMSLRMRFDRDADAADLDRAITVGRTAGMVAAPRERMGALSQLSVAYYMRFELTGDAGDLDEAIGASSAALLLSPDGTGRTGDLTNLSLALRKRSEIGGNPTDVEGAVVFGRKAVERTGPRDPALTSRLLNLGLALTGRYRQSGDRDERDEVVRIAQQLAERGAPIRTQAVLQSGLVGALAARDQVDDPAVLDDLVDASRRLAVMLRDDPMAGGYAHASLSIAVRYRFDRTGDREDIEEAVGASRAAAATAGLDIIADRLFDLGGVLFRRFESFGNPADLDESITVTRAALRGSSAVGQTDPTYANNLSVLLSNRYEHFNESTDLDEAVAAARLAAPGGTGFLDTLARVLLLRYDRAGDRTDLDDAIETARAGIDATPADAPERGMPLANLAVMLRKRFEADGRPADLTDAVGVARSAVDAPVERPMDRQITLAALANALMSRYRHDGDLQALGEAVEMYRAQRGMVAADHPNLGTIESNLAIALLERFRSLGEAGDRQEAADCFRTAVTTASTPLPVRLSAAGRWAYAAASEDLAAEETGQAYGLLAGLLPLLAWRGSGRTDVEWRLARWEDVPGDAAAAAIAGGRAATAVEWLEQSRAVRWSQRLETRGELAALRAADPARADRLIAVRTELDRLSIASELGQGRPAEPDLVVPVLQNL
ncbi:tetratricopeptide repeat protein [Micromonospora sp. NPDC049891]|uniref:tetratricopeptide repeat protein n=1 Tax=Micromonospora sp. NPDC049891 TaxID=3155655 RepID=UPI003409CBAE